MTRLAPKVARTFFYWISIAIFAITFQFNDRTAYAGGGPENVLIVVNENSDASKLIANHYVSLRSIPDRNVVYLDGIPFQESISLTEFRELILLPVLQELEKRKLAGSIDYIIYSADFPTSVKIGPHVEALKKKITDRGLGFQKKLYNPTASITSLTYFAGQIVVNNPSYISLTSNRYYRLPTDGVLNQPFVGEMLKVYQDATAKIKSPANSDEFKEAIKTLEALASENPGQAAVLYWLAKFHAVKGNASESTKYLTRAIRMGWNDRGRTMTDTDFDLVKDNPLFKGIVDRIESGGRFLATRGFRQLHPWAPNGMLNHGKGQGERYFLSTVLAVTRNDGLTELESVKQIQTSVASDFTSPRGTFYFCETSDVRTKTRKPNFAAAMKALKRLGYPSEIVKSKLPTKQAKVLGVTSGAATYDWSKSQSEIVPGAICENLTSFGGRVGAIGGQTKLVEFLRYGAAGSSGTVTEPYALQQKFPHPMIHAHYAAGSSLAEAFYQSLHGPFQTLIVGDALCQPFATEPEITVSGISSTEKTTGKIKLRIEDRGSMVPVAGMELFVDGVLARRDSSFEPIDFDTNKISDGYHELRIVAVANNLIETRGRRIIPFIVDNRGHSTTILASKVNFDISDSIRFEVKSNFGKEIVIVQNRREVGSVDSIDGYCTVSAKDLGRGPVTVRAVAVNEQGKFVSSTPIKLNIQGPFAKELPKTAKPKKRTRSK